MKRVVIALGSRSEAIKLAPIIRVLREQHRHQLQTRAIQADNGDQELWQALSLFGLTPDESLDIHANAENNIVKFSHDVTNGMAEQLDQTRPDLMVVNGDSLLSVLAAQQAFLRRIPIVHIEGGVRSYESSYDNQYESHRRMLSAMANFHCVSNAHAANNLRSEGFPVYEIGITGNPMIDAIEQISAQGALARGVNKNLPPPTLQKAKIFAAIGQPKNINDSYANFEFAFALANLAHDYPGLNFVVASCPGVKMDNNLRSILSSIKTVELKESPDYLEFIKAMDGADLVLSGSCDIQDEAITLGKPILIMQDATERPELIRLGGGRLIGSSQDEISEGIRETLHQRDVYQHMRRAQNPFGDGRASQRIGKLIANWSRNRVLTPHSFEPFVFQKTADQNRLPRYH